MGSERGGWGLLTSSPVLPVTLPKAFWTAPVAESTYDLRVELLLLLADMLMVVVVKMCKL